MRDETPAGGKPREAKNAETRVASYTWDQIAAHLHHAGAHADTGRSVPKFQRFGWFKRRLARWVARGVLHVSKVVTLGQRECNVGVIHAVQELVAALQHIENAARDSTHAIASELASLKVHVERMNQNAAKCEGIQKAHGRRLRSLARNVAEWSGANQARDAKWREQIRGMEERIEVDRHELRRVNETIDGHRSAMDRLHTAWHEATGIIDELRRDLSTRHAEALKSHANLRTQQMMLDTRLRSLQAEVRRKQASPPLSHDAPPTVGDGRSDLDAQYLAFEDQFRGARGTIKDRLRVYLPLFQPPRTRYSVLDLGCGRGEWLELLQEEGVSARGVDMNQAMIADCAARDLDATLGDALGCLRALPDECLTTITAFHLIEHLTFDDVIALFDQALRVLKPGGWVLFETPNPENVLVGSTYFWADPTHERPLFPATMQFVAEQRGFIDARIWRVNANGWIDDPIRRLPENHDLAPWLNPLIDVAKERFFAAPDFAIIAEKVCDG
jgi:O-antigen chain-terminating methyltransferase